MNRLLKNSLPIAALLALLAFAGLVVLLGIGKQKGLSALVERPEHAEALEAIELPSGTTFTDTAFLRATAGRLRLPHVASVWLIDSKGIIRLAEGSLAPSTPVDANIADLADERTRRTLKALPENLLGADATLFLLAESAIMREGEHRDIYRTLLRPVRNPDGTSAGIVAIAFDASDWQPGILWKAGVLLAPIAFLLYWLALPAWVYLDAKEHGENRWTWACFVFVGNLVALMAYLLSVRAGADTEKRGTTE